MATVIEYLSSLHAGHVLFYWGCFVVIEQLVIRRINSRCFLRIETMDKLLINYWEGFGFAIPFIWLCFELSSGVKPFEVLLVGAVATIYGLIKPRALKKKSRNQTS